MNINEFISYNLTLFVLNYNLVGIISIFADLPIFFLPIFFIGAWLYCTFKENKPTKKTYLLLMFYSIILAIIINLIIQYFVPIQRPDTFITPILSHVPDNSFPSDHAAVSFAFLAGLFLFGFRRLFWYFLFFVLFMNFCRISGGLHWFFDVLVGACVGVFSTFLFYKIQNKKYIKIINSFFLKLSSFFKL